MLSSIKDGEMFVIMDPGRFSSPQGRGAKGLVIPTKEYSQELGGLNADG